MLSNILREIFVHKFLETLSYKDSRIIWRRIFRNLPKKKTFFFTVSSFAVSKYRRSSTENDKEKYWKFHLHRKFFYLGDSRKTIFHSADWKLKIRSILLSFDNSRWKLPDSFTTGEIGMIIYCIEIYAWTAIKTEIIENISQSILRHRSIVFQEKQSISLAEAAALGQMKAEK